MIVTGLIKRYDEKTDRVKNYNLKIEAVLNPTNSYLVGFSKNLTTNDEREEKYSLFEYRNIISIIYGTISENGHSFDLQIVVYANGQELINHIINSECQESCNYIFDYKGYDYIDGDLYIINMNDISTLPDFKGKSVVECIQYFMELKDLSDHRLLFQFHKFFSKNKLMNIHEFANYTNNKF